MLLTEEIKQHFKNLCIAANHTLTRNEYRKINNISEYNSSKIESLWGTWKNFIADVSFSINFNRYTIKKSIKNNINNIVISSVIDGSRIDFECFQALIAYSKEEKCQLYILWNKAVKPNAHFSKNEYEILEPYLVTELNFEKDNKCKAIDLLISPSAKNPLQNLDKLSKGLNTIVVSSPKQYLEVLPYDPDSVYKLAASTGTISLPCYKSNVSGLLDEQNHTLGGLRLEWDNDQKRYNIRQLQFKDGYIGDLGIYYSKDGAICKGGNVSCMILGDLHAPETDEVALNTTIDLIKDLKPKDVMIHDWISYQSINHHEENKVLTKLLNTTEETKDLKTEIDCALKILNKLAKSCPESKINIVHSNHDEFLTKWLNEGEFVKGNPVNRIAGCELFANIANGLEVIPKHLLAKNVKFLPFCKSVIINDYEVGKHGDVGIAGAKGNTNAYVKTYNKSITGHTHSPKIKESGVVVGTLSKLKLSYNKNSISNWAHANCILYTNGTFQLIFV